MGLRCFFYSESNDKDPIAVSFGRIGDLKGGVKTTRKVNYHIEVNSGLRFQYLFYTKGSKAIALTDLISVYNKPETLAWGIPWEERLAQHLEIGTMENISSPPKPFNTIPLLKDGKPIRERGIKEASAILVIKRTGKVELKIIDERLLPNEINSIKSSLSEWSFFPCLKNGKAVDLEVRIPLKF